MAGVKGMKMPQGLGVGEKNPFYGKHHSERSKAKMCETKTGVSRNAEEREDHREKYKQRWRDEHPEKIREYDVKYLEPKAIANSKRRHRLRMDIIAKLGGRCSSRECRWMNADGSMGCMDVRVLHIDHIDGGGTKERNRLNVEAMWKKVLASTSGYQLLCSNCNWIKAHENGEFRVKYRMEAA